VAHTFGVRERPKVGQSISGDGYVIRELASGAVLVALIDGLGSGEPAAAATRHAVEVLNTHAERPLQELTNAIHLALRSTRGAVAGLLKLEPSTHHARYVGVGNIGVYVESSQAIKPISKSGILGFRMPQTLLEMQYTYHPGDIFVLFSDGLSANTGQNGSINVHHSAQQIADALFTANAKDNDDATIVVVKS
jgi:phosphoserine phosphatase RsbX